MNLNEAIPGLDKRNWKHNKRLAQRYHVVTRAYRKPQRHKHCGLPDDVFLVTYVSASYQMKLRDSMFLGLLLKAILLCYRRKVFMGSQRI